uniref:RAB11 family interacting protein 4 n=1 Tax=Chelonoidis abingdonii TaxID=106734 RepID=A0A8C0IMF6_CHEAB
MIYLSNTFFSKTSRGSEIQDSAYLDGESAYSESELFPDEDTMTLAQQEVHHESDMDSAIESAQSSEASDVCGSEEKDSVLMVRCFPHNPSAASDLSTYSTASLISNEEQFEDYGEGDDVDYTPSSPCPDDETRTNAYSDLGSSVSSSAGQTPRKMRHIYNSELLDVYCSQCCKKINLLNDLEASTLFSAVPFEMTQLFHNSNFSSSNGSTEDLFRDSIDSCDNDITEKVTYLEKKVTELENDNVTNGDLKSKLKQENTQLVHRGGGLQTSHVRGGDVWIIMQRC